MNLSTAKKVPVVGDSVIVIRKDQDKTTEIPAKIYKISHHVFWANNDETRQLLCGMIPLEGTSWRWP